MNAQAAAPAEAACFEAVPAAMASAAARELGAAAREARRKVRPGALQAPGRSPLAIEEGVGWTTGVEPATTESTVRCSAN